MTTSGRGLRRRSTRMPAWLFRGLAMFLVALGSVVVFQVADAVLRLIVWRTRWRPGIEFLRRYNRVITNRRASRVAGRPGSQMTAVHHKGRTSGKEYVTPVWAARVGRSFYIQLLYGTDVDWCRNTLADGGCTLDSDGVRYAAFAPTIVPAAEAVALLPPGLRRMQRLAAVESYLRLDTTPTPAPVTTSP